MYLSLQYILESIKRLNHVHPFFGITFLTCKKALLPVGNATEFPMDKYTKNFLDDFHKISLNSKFYYQPYTSNSRKKFWIDQKYPSHGLQAINTQTFKDVFIHEDEKTWGWVDNYIDILINSKQMKSIKALPVLALAIWIFKDKNWENDSDLNKIISYFYQYFNITKAEKQLLFNEDIKNYPAINPFQESKVTWNDLSNTLVLPPDARPSRGATLSYLKLENVGPASSIEMEPSNRLNIVTGDNGLGKSFLMECAWWSLTGTWPESPAYPRESNGQTQKGAITYELASAQGRPIRRREIYDVKQGIWPRDKEVPTIPGLIIYARVDGSYAVWDPIKQYSANADKQSCTFSRKEIWDGNENIEGLLRDWVKWQSTSTPDKYPFEILKNVLKRMSPPDMGELKPGHPVRLMNNIKEIPTIIHPYGEVPIINASAGVKQIITLAYLIVWAWYEHKVRADLSHMSPENRMVILIDEIEAHLHPKWQRVILPALLDVQTFLSNELEIQFIVSTHSPLVLASAETSFNPETDRLFHLDPNQQTGDAELKQLDFVKYGHVDSWLTSPVFNLGQARAQEAEKAIEHAKQLQLQSSPDLEEVKNVHKQLTLTLSESDPFWPRWIYFAEKHGVKI